DPTPQCYTLVGKSLQANRLLLATITGGSGRRKERSVKIRVMLFDVDKGAEITSAEKHFKNKDNALADAEELVNQALGDRKQASADPTGKSNGYRSSVPGAACPCRIRCSRVRRARSCAVTPAKPSYCGSMARLCGGPRREPRPAFRWSKRAR